MAGLSKMAGALSASEFKLAAGHFPRLSQKALDVSRAVLVEGKSLLYVEQHCDVSRQQAHQWASKIYGAFKPSGWVSAVVTLPAADMEKVKLMERAARDRLKKQSSRGFNHDASGVRAVAKSARQR